MLKDKIITLQSLDTLKQEWLDKKLKVVFTNGCFDILHAGHVQYLEQAKCLGDILIVGINSDMSVQRLKGLNRPINNQNSRAIVLAGLQSVDYVVVFEEDTPYRLIENIQPDVLVKGGDWDLDRIIGSDIVLAKGGQVLSLPYWEGLSTTAIVRKIIQE